MRTYGYIIRVATKEQDEDRQRIGMWSFGVAEDNVVLIDPLNVFQDAPCPASKDPYCPQCSASGRRWLWPMRPSSSRPGSP